MWWGLVRHRRTPISDPSEFYEGNEFCRQPFPRHPAPHNGISAPAAMPFLLSGTLISADYLAECFFCTIFAENNSFNS